MNSFSVCRPLARNIPCPPGATLALCRYCGEECWRLLREPDPLPAGVRAACTECALRRHNFQQKMDDALTVKVVDVHDYREVSKDGRRFIYVGRRSPTWGLFAHPLANPFRVTRAEPERVRRRAVEQYRQWLAEHPKRSECLTELLDEVNRTGFPLGCWCGNYPDDPDLLCHAVVLALALNDLERAKHA